MFEWPKAWFYMFLLGPWRRGGWMIDRPFLVVTLVSL